MINNQNNRRVASVTRLRMVTESDSFIRIRRSFKMKIQFLKRIDNCKVLW